MLIPGDGSSTCLIAAFKISGIPVPTDFSLRSASVPALKFSDGSMLKGTYVLLRYIGRMTSQFKLYGKDSLESAEIDEWLDYVTKFTRGSEFEVACSQVDGYLSNKTYMVGTCLSIADLALWSILSGTGKRWDSLRQSKSKKYVNLVRWYNSITTQYGSSLNEILGTHHRKMVLGRPIPGNLEDQALHIQSNRVTGDKYTNIKAPRRPEFDLPGAEVGKVCLRFAPEPSGFLHIGHVKAAILNKYFADKYSGCLIVRFDDTNPAKEKKEFVESLRKDIESLGIDCKSVTYTSNYFPQLMDMAEKLISRGKAYVDDTPKDQLSAERDKGIESRCRNNSVKKNIELWKEMIAGSEIGKMCCLRGKLDFQNPNKCLRDPVYYRYVPCPHHHVETNFTIYPTYDFANPFVDAWEGITHALRSNEYRDRDAQYHWIQEDMEVRKVEIYEFSRLNMVYSFLSKRKMAWFVQNGMVDGWNDPRLPTVQGMLRRGLKIEALVQFIMELGASVNQNLMEWDKLWSINKRIIDPVCPRHSAVFEERRVMIALSNGPSQPQVSMVLRHKKFEGLGYKRVVYTKDIWIDYADALSISVDEEVTLMDWQNAIIKEIKRDEMGNVMHLVGVLHPDGSFKNTKLKLTWLPQTDELVKLQLVEFDYLITKKKLAKKSKGQKDSEEDFQEFLNAINPVTKKETLALGDLNMRHLKRGDIVQLERKGYFICDIPFVKAAKPIVLFAIPDGRQKSVLKASFA